MDKDDIINEYFNWMCDKITDPKYHGDVSYMKLLSQLHNTEFTYIIDGDINRFNDGIDLKNRFVYELRYPYEVINICLDPHNCSVLEMMVALAIRCEESIMDDPFYGNRTGKWFWGMIDSLGLKTVHDDNYNRQYVDNVIFKFLNRDYDPNGEGGLFTIIDCHDDLRNIEIWYQMCWYLDEII